MVIYCCVNGCGINSRNKKTNPNLTVSFHVFPANKELRSKWLRAIGRPNWSPPIHVRICSAHFTHEQINEDTCKIRLKDDAVPILLLPPNSNFVASDVEACKICLATDIKLYSLQDTHLGSCMKSIAGLNHNGVDLEDMPQYVCYQCAPILLKCNQLIEKCRISQATLLDIFAKNGQITKDLIKEQNISQLKLKPPLENTSLENDYLLTYYDDTKNTSPSITTDSICNDHDYFLSQDNTNIDTDMYFINNKECEVKASETEFYEINDNDVVEEIIINTSDDVIASDDLHKDLSSDAQNKEEFETHNRTEKLSEIESIELTPDETNMLKYFDIVNVSLNDQLQEWEKSPPPLSDDGIHIVGRVQCPICKRRFSSTALATSHARRAHIKKFFCKMCPKAFSNVMLAKKHQRWHSGYLYKCDSCAFSTPNQSSLGIHRRRAHPTAHACTLCGRAYSTRRGLHAHINTAHGSVKAKDIKVSKEFRCEPCGTDFASEGARRIHILTANQHSRKPNLRDTEVQETHRNICNKCGVECSSFRELSRHMKSEHPPPGNTAHSPRTYPIDCELCGETLANHMKHWHHVRLKHPKNLDSYKRAQNIAFICDTCGKGCQSSTKLRLHQLRHRSPAERCAGCARLFYDKYALALHQRTHRAERPHQCRTCGRAFKRRSNLERHYRVHTDIATYECTICGKKMKHSSSLKLHVRTVHYNMPYPVRKKRNKSVKAAIDS